MIITEKAADRVPVKRLEEFCLDVLGRCGVGAEHARQTTDVLVTTDTFGVFTHGTKALRGYVRRLRAGGLKADAVPEICAEGPAWATVDGHSGLGMVTSIFAMNTAMRKAKTVGTAYVAVRNSCHFGAAGYYANLAAAAGMFGMAMANDTPSMAVPGSRSAVMGTNPFAYAVPAGSEPPVFWTSPPARWPAARFASCNRSTRKCPKTGWLMPRACRPPIRSSTPTPARCCRSAATRATALR